MTGPVGRGRGRTAALRLGVGGLAWQADARCAAVGGDLFFDEGDSRRAKAFCALCPVWQACLTYGLDEEHGVWGGLTRAERARLVRLRERLSTSPEDPENERDVGRLVRRAGLAIGRLAVVLGVEAATADALLDVPDGSSKTGDVPGLGLAS